MRNLSLTNNQDLECESDKRRFCVSLFNSVLLIPLFVTTASLSNELFAVTLSTPSTPDIVLLESANKEGDSSDGKTEATYLSFDEFTSLRMSEGVDTLTLGDWSNTLGSFRPAHTENGDWFRVTIPPYGSGAAKAKLFLDPSIKEAWASYEMQLGTNWSPTSGVKLPGFSSHVNDSWRGDGGGNGGGWGGLCRSWSARSLIAPPGNANGRLRLYVYHAESDNHQGTATRSDHPCMNPRNNPVLPDKRTFGDTINSTGHITDNDWHTVTHHVKLNDIGSYNGFLELYLDGEMILKATDLNFTNNPEYHNISFWFLVYHGGAPDKSGTKHDIFFSNFRWNAGSENLTWEK